MSDVRTMTVCLSKTAATHQAPTAVSALLAAHGITDAGLTRRFRTTARPLRARLLTRSTTTHLLEPDNGTAAGGPVRLLDLAAMRDDLAERYWNRHMLWQQIVAGSPEAKPWWHFYDRHAADPDKYSWDAARHAFASQPRIARMLTFNAHPARPTELPTDHLDAFETGPYAYSTYGLLQAVPAGMMLTIDGRVLRPIGSRYADQLDYLRMANDHLNTLSDNDVLVAVTTK